MAPQIGENGGNRGPIRGAQAPRHRLGPMKRSLAFPAVTYAFAVVMLGTTMPTPMYALYAEELGFSVLTQTVIFATYAAGVLVALLAFGRWSDVLGRRPMLLIGAACAVASAIVFLTAGPVAQLLVGRVLSGLSAGIYAGTATTAVIELAPDRWKDRAPAVATAANIGGLGLGPLLAGLLVEYAPAPLQLSFALHIVLVALAIAAVWLLPETAERTPGATLGLQRLAVPAEVRSVFVPAAIAAFAGFAVLGSFTGVAPGFVSQIIGVSSHAVAGLVVFSLFAASAVAQIASRPLPTHRALVVGCGLLIVGTVVIGVALPVASLALLVLGAVVAGAGQGMSFSKGLAAVAGRTPPQRRAEVTSSFFVVAYVAISLPVVGEGLAARSLGLERAGMIFAAAVAALALVALVTLVRRRDA